MYKVLESKEIDKELGLLWEEVKVIEEETNNNITYRKDFDKSGYKIEVVEIDDVRYGINVYGNLSKVHRGKVKKETQEKFENMKSWANKNIWN